MNGVLIVDKPDGPTSHDVVRWARKVFGTRSVGHAGTLDPMATGVLVVAVGEATKLVPYLTASDKRYEAEITLGLATDTLDARGKEIARAEIPEGLTERDVAAALASFVGGYDQRAPVVSAIKRDGRSLHARVRAGEEVEAPVRRVELHEAEVEALDGEKIRITVHCGKGFYVRSLARDLAEKLGTLGHLSALRRTASGAFGLEGSVDGLALREAAADPARRSAIHGALLTLEEATSFMPTVRVNEEGRADAWNGRPIDPSRFTPEGAEPSRDEPLRILDARGDLLAIGAFSDDGRVRVVRGFRPGERGDSLGA